MRFSIEAVNSSVLGSFASGDLTASIDKLNAEMAKFKGGVYPAQIFVDVWDMVHASMSKVMDMTRQVTYSNKIPSLVKDQIRASGERLTKTLMLLRADDDLVGLAWKARLKQVGYVTAPNFRALAIEVLRQSERTKATVEYIVENIPVFASLIFDLNAEIDDWIADRTRKAAAVLTGQLDPYVDKKTEEAIAKGVAEANRLVEEQRASIWSYVIGGGIVLAGAVGLWLAFRKKDRA